MSEAYLKHRQWYTNKSVRRQIVAADDSTSLGNLIAPKTANHQLFIQRIHFYETTESNGKNLTFTDDNTTPLVLGKYFSITLAAGISKSLELDFGPEGIALGAGKNLDVTVSAAGIAGSLMVEAYERIVTGAIHTGLAASAQ